MLGIIGSIFPLHRIRGSHFQDASLSFAQVLLIFMTKGLTSLGDLQPYKSGHKPLEWDKPCRQKGDKVRYGKTKAHEPTERQTLDADRVGNRTLELKTNNGR